MQTYRCHKQVDAGSIASIVRDSRNPHNFRVTLNDGEVLDLPHEAVSRYMPVQGDYFVRYQDGYCSISPKAAFEDGYSVGDAAPVAPSVAVIDPQKAINDMIVGVASVCHAVNRAACEAFGDLTQVAWADAPEWQRDSACQGVAFAMDNPDAAPGAQHEAWSKAKIADSWIYGETKDAEKKTHPCLVPFDQLPVEQRLKDFLFIAVVRSLLTPSTQALTKIAEVVEKAPKAPKKAPTPKNLPARKPAKDKANA